jgi:hypothetical protein
MGVIKFGDVTYTGGDGDTVTWTQTQVSGTKIAEITINGVTQNVYIPELPQAESESV